MMLYILHYDSNEICVYSITRMPHLSQRTNHHMRSSSCAICSLPFVPFCHAYHGRSFIFARARILREQLIDQMGPVRCDRMPNLYKILSSTSCTRTERIISPIKLWPLENLGCSLRTPWVRFSISSAACLKTTGPKEHCA